jgi:hypothetical protein
VVPRLAIVISAAGGVEALEATLVSVLENRPADCEVLVALARPYADPYDLKDEVRFLAPTRRTSAVVALNRALASVRSPIVHLLAAGCVVSEGWTEAAVSHFADRQIAAVAPWVWNIAQPGTLLSAGISYQRNGRRHLVGQGVRDENFQPPATVIGPASFAAFYRQTVLELLGAFSTKLTLRQADIDLALAIRHAGFRVAVERGTKVLAPVEIDAPSSALSDARAEERLFWRNLERASFGTIVSHSAIAAWDCLSELPRPTALLRMAGRAWANLELGSHAQHRRRLAQLKAHATTTAAQSTQSRENLRIDASHHSPARSEQTQPIRARSS